MKKYKGLVIVCLLMLEIFTAFLTYKSYANKLVDEIKEVNKIDRNTFAMYIENDNGNYEEYTDSNYWPGGYVLNESKTTCVDSKGESANANAITFGNKKITVSSNKTLFCYLYFDKDKSVYGKVASDYISNNGVKLLEETESDEYPVYYYNGNITNNNILFGGFCWKMVRTTETGGVKLIYNGIPDESEDGTLTCDNTGEESQIGKSAFNSSADSPAYVGYMYNTVYNSTSKGAENAEILETTPGRYTFYGDTATWDGSKYILSNSDGSELVEYNWTEKYNDLIGKYTCQSVSLKSCPTVHYIVGGTKTLTRYISISNGKNKNDYTIKLATSITDNENGTYTLINPIEILKIDWFTNYSNYKNYYYCVDLTSETCSDMYYSTTLYSTYISGININNVYKYGNSFTYENGTYTLVDTIEFWDWSTNYNTLNNNHYTCFNTTGKCEEVNYIYQASSVVMRYVTISGGKGIENAINEMFYADDVNKTDSTIKEYIDDWYEGAILNKTDENENLYSDYLENTIFCNNRKITNLGSWNPNGGNNTSIFNLKMDADSLNCENKNDQFTLKVEAGGTEDYGNNALDYPVALLSNKEALLAGSSGYLSNGIDYWLISPYGFYSANASVQRMKFDGNTNLYYTHTSFGVRPSLSLANKIEIIDGTGEVDSPYQIELPS